MTIQTMSPSEIDGRLRDLMQAQARVEHQAHGVESRLDRHQSAKRPWDRLDDAAVARLEGQLADLHEQSEALGREQSPYLAEYQRRGGWTRAFYVTNVGGHLHESRSCSTCYPTTSFSWLTDLSGMDEAAIVELAGEKACTVCWPTAPVDVLKRASRLAPDVEARKARSERDAEKAAKTAEKAAKAIVMPDGSPLKVRYTSAATVVSAWREATGAAADLLWYGEDHPSAPEWRTFVGMAVEALSAKLDRDPAEISEEIAAKAAAKHKRDAKAAEKHAKALGLPYRPH